MLSLYSLEIRAQSLPVIRHTFLVAAQNEKVAEAHCLRLAAERSLKWGERWEVEGIRKIEEVEVVGGGLVGVKICRWEE